MQSPARANKVMDSIYQAIKEAADHPFSHPILRLWDNKDESIRKVVIHNTYILIYRILTDHILVLDIYHGKQNPDRLRSFIK